tara:strand:+ start:219 stop:506 length:288 start_codon:yes stop_codon:yes gene_type:complete
MVKKLIAGTFVIILLCGCVQNASLIGPVYTLATSGNIYQAGFAYGGNEIITKKTGKSVAQNFKEVISIKKEDTEFQKLVKKNVQNTRKKLNLSNQ